MAQTKVKLVSNGVITVDNLHTNHGITTDHIGEGSNLYYSEARIQNYLNTNNYITRAEVSGGETLTTLSLANNTLTYVDEAGTTFNIDLSPYLDYTASSWFNTTNNSANWDTAYLWGDHASAGYLTSFTETDPIYVASSWYTTTNNAGNWDAAYNWGDHAGLYSLLGHNHTESDITDFGNYVTSITHDTVNTKLVVTNRDSTTTDLSLAQYIDDTNLARLVSGTLDGGTGVATFTRDDSSTFTVDFSAFLSDANDYVSSASFNTSDGVLTLTRFGGETVTVDLDNRYLTSFTETDPIYTTSSWYTTTNNSSNWNTAYGWGNHASAGYLTSFNITTQTDPKYLRSDTADTASGTITFSSIYSGGTGDFTNLSNPSYKVSAGSGYWRIPHISSSSVTSGVYNFETGKSVYWGEPGDTGDYRFRGRRLFGETGVQAPTYYALTNTGYYVDPAGTSNLNFITGVDFKSTSTSATPRYDTAFFVLQAQHWYGDTNGQIMYLGENANDVLIRGQVAIGGEAIQSGYALTMTGSIDMNNGTVDYVGQLHFQDNVRFYDDGNDSYLNFKHGNTSYGGIKFYDGGNILRGFIYSSTGGFGLLDNDGHWAVRTQTGTSPLELRCNNNVEFEVYDSYTLSPGSSRAPIFYDSNDTNTYFDSNRLVIRGTDPTVILRDTNHNSAMLHCNSNLLYVLRGGNDTTTWTQVNGQWPATWNLTNNLYSGGGAATFVGDVTANTSDKRLKENIKNIPDAIEKVKSLNGVTFDWKDNLEEIHYTRQRIHDVGVIAQEVQAVLPDAVRPAPFDTDEEGNSRSGENYLTVQYEKIVPLLIEAIKEQQQQIEELKALINK